MHLAIAQINTVLGDLKGNTKKIIDAIERAKKAHADLIVFPELTITGYPPEDLLLLAHFIKEVEKQLEEIIPHTANLAAIVGLPRRAEFGEKYLFNSAAILNNGELLGYQDKILLPTYDVFDERRYFEPGKEIQLWELSGKKIAVTICEDIWQHSELIAQTSYRIDPVLEYSKLKPDLLINLSSSPFSIHKAKNRLRVCEKVAHTVQAPVVLCNQVGGNDSLIFDGYSLVFGKDGLLKKYAKGFEEDLLIVEPFDNNQKSCSFPIHETEDTYKALVLGVRDYFLKSNFHRACLGLSGGIDSALVACIAKEALGCENVLGVSMPSCYSSKEGTEDAKRLSCNLDIQFSSIPIEGPFTSYLNLLNPYFQNRTQDSTEENIQARIRGMILMAISNKLEYIVLSTGNKSELALGYATLYGDMCGGLAVISDVAKKQVYDLAHWINRDKEIIPRGILSREPSAELRPNQKDSDSLPPYEMIDNVLAAYVEEHQSCEEIVKKYHYPIALVEDLIKRIHRNEYKRRQAAPGLRITEKSFSVGRHFPIVQRWV